MNKLVMYVVCVLILSVYINVKATTPYPSSDESFPESLMVALKNSENSVSTVNDFEITLQILSKCIQQGKAKNNEVLCGNVIGVVLSLIKNNQPDQQLIVDLMTKMELFKSHYGRKQQLFDRIYWFSIVRMIEDKQKQIDFLKLELGTKNYEDALFMLAETGAETTIDAIKMSFKHQPQEINLEIAKDRAALIRSLKTPSNYNQDEFDEIYIRNLSHVIEGATENSSQARYQGKWIIKKMYQFNNNELMSKVLNNQAEDELFYVKNLLKSVSSSKMRAIIKNYIRNNLKLQAKSKDILLQ